jgi:serine/threonine protein kinase
MGIDVGEVIAKKFELVRRLGRGSMGDVWIARHRTLGENVAIKFLAVSDPLDGEAATLQERFLFEAQVAARLSRKAAQIVSVTDHGVDDGAAYLVMELLEGDTLQALIGRAGPRPLTEVVEIVSQAAKGLAVAHAEGVLHRDLNSANLFVTRDANGRLLLKILDFGLARSIRSPRRTARGMVLGSPEYMSPEQALGLSSLDQRCDVWALAVVAYESLTGALPYDADPPEKWLEEVQSGAYARLLDRRPDLPHALEAFFERAFAPRIEDRFRTAAALADAFERAATEMSLPAAREGYMRRALEPLPVPTSGVGRFRPHVVLAALMLGAMIICILAVVRATTATRSSAGAKEALGTPPGSSAPASATIATARDPEDSSSPLAPPSASDPRPAETPEGRRVTAAPRSPSPTTRVAPSAAAPPRPSSSSVPARAPDRDNVF